MNVLIKGMDMPKTCMDCPFKGFDRAGGRGNICTIDESITLHAVLDGVDVKFIRMGDCPLIEVVHCKDCVRHTDEELGMVYCPHIVGGWCDDDWFCKSGERRTDERTN